MDLAQPQDLRQMNVSALLVALHLPVPSQGTMPSLEGFFNAPEHSLEGLLGSSPGPLSFLVNRAAKLSAKIPEDRLPGFIACLYHYSLLLGKLVNLFDPHFPTCQMGIIIVPHSVVTRIKWGA